MKSKIAEENLLAEGDFLNGCDRQYGEIIEWQPLGLELHGIRITAERHDLEICDRDHSV